nr:hypothetical protein Hi04_10k_c5981_00041 [uncultured bacterium]
MSIRDALQFIARVRSDETIRHDLRQLGIDPELSDVIAIAKLMGLNFSVEELKSAYGYEWTMRSIYYGFSKKTD